MAISSMSVTARRLTAAEGFLDLELPKLALEELDGIEEPGSLRIPYLWLKAAALRADGRLEEAAAPLRLLAQCVPSPISERAQQLLSQCLAQVDHSASPDDIKPASPEAQTPALETKPPHCRTLQINIPHVGQFSLTVVGGHSLSISIERSPSAPRGDETPEH